MKTLRCAATATPLVMPTKVGTRDLPS